jgi:tripartite-type tricarboxylate transporter receptor subunit TctC
MNNKQSPGDALMPDHPALNSLRRQLLLAAIGTAALPTAWAQQSKTLRVIVPFPPGGTTDILARAVGAKLAQSQGQALLIDNKPGARGSLGATEAAKAEADGNTLLMGHIGTLAVNPSLYPKLGYDPLKSFAPVAWVARVPNVLVVNANAPVKNFKEFLAYARARPGKLSYSSGGNGSAAHISFEYLKLKTQIFMLHIPYRGTAPSINDLIGGQVDATFTGAPTVLTHIRSGKLRALAVSSPQRLAALPDVPTVAESGYPGFEADQWYGFVAPAATPATVVARLNAAINKALQDPGVAQQLAAEGALATPTSPKAYGELIAKEIPRWAEVIRAGNVRPD